MEPEAYHLKVNALMHDIPGVQSYLDDIIIWGNTQEEHDSRLRRVLETLRKNNINLNADKCEFGRQELYKECVPIQEK